MFLSLITSKEVRDRPNVSLHEIQFIFVWASRVAHTIKCPSFRPSVISLGSKETNHRKGLRHPLLLIEALVTLRDALTALYHRLCVICWW